MPGISRICDATFSTSGEGHGALDVDTGVGKEARGISFVIRKIKHYNQGETGAGEELTETKLNRPAQTA